MRNNIYLFIRLKHNRIEATGLLTPAQVDDFRYYDNIKQAASGLNVFDFEDQWKFNQIVQIMDENDKEIKQNGVPGVKPYFEPGDGSSLVPEIAPASTSPVDANSDAGDDLPF